jgi:hypothetical protein
MAGAIMASVARRLEAVRNAARERLAVLKLEDSTEFYLDAERARFALFGYLCRSVDAVHQGTDRPAPPEILRIGAKLPSAEDRAAFLEACYPQEHKLAPFDFQAFIERGAIDSGPLVSGPLFHRETGKPAPVRPLREGKTPDLEPQDLSRRPDAY